ncbi:hypothetical protein BBK82_29225 [Lentzea guizhouensis]|uniref:Glycosyltransferase 2-like domain-containing protein n=1 Tax=Lentzea guizhouensis TaxID=1586287 RepID=A0A1B2HP78_9PSEU|nr:hypothetical protein [Lentzea guizhouensis]ANZ39524.1 hypothetical protein BBK82_29225 [Lentzea guizhouensis]
MKNATRVRSEHHHGSHRGLLVAPRPTPPAQVQAIIVPTIRPPRAVQHAIDLAAALGCVLVALCSTNDTSTVGVVRRAAAAGVEALAIDVDDLPPRLLPEFETCARLKGTRFEPRSDLSLKRNLGLLLARVAKWERIVFLDDDIEIPDPSDLGKAAALTDDHAGVGLKIEGYPDNSVVCHAYREAGGAQDMFVGGGAMAVHAGTTSSFFPDIYNEDWFFLLGDRKLRRTTVIGTAVQKPYDPFNVEERARAEEFGDVLAEGLFWLLDEGRPLQHADARYWSQYLVKRKKFILETMELTKSTEMLPDRKAKKLRSLTAALGRSRFIQPKWCEEYVDAWRKDRSAWQKHLDHHQQHAPRESDLGKVIAHLGLTHITTYF